MSHKFKIGQRVRQAQAGDAHAATATGPEGEVVRLMPEDRTGEPSYRIRTTMGERAVREGEIRPIS